MTKEETLRDEIALYVVQRVGELRPIPNNAEPYMMLVSTDELIKIVSDALLSAPQETYLDKVYRKLGTPQDRDVGGDWRFTPMEVEMLLHLYAIAEPLPRMFATVREAALQSFIERGFVRPSKSSGSGYRTTKLGERVVNAICNPSTPPSVAVIPDGWQPIETQPDFMERPGRQFIRIEGEAEHSGMCWSRVWCGEAYIRKEGADDEMLGYRKSDILRLCKDGDMIPSSARVTHWMPARFPLLTLSASPSVLDAGLPAYVPPNHPWPSAADMPTAYESVDSISSGGTAPIPDAARIAIKDEAREEAAKVCESRMFGAEKCRCDDWEERLYRQQFDATMKTTAGHIRSIKGQP